MKLRGVPLLVAFASMAATSCGVMKNSMDGVPKEGYHNQMGSNNVRRMADPTHDDIQKAFVKNGPNSWDFRVNEKNGLLYSKPIDLDKKGHISLAFAMNPKTNEITALTYDRKTVDKDGEASTVGLTVVNPKDFEPSNIEQLVKEGHATAAALKTTTAINHPKPRI